MRKSFLSVYMWMYMVCAYHFPTKPTASTHTHISRIRILEMFISYVQMGKGSHQKHRQAERAYFTQSSNIKIDRN